MHQGRPGFRVEESFMQLRPATLVVVACVAALFGFAGAASRTCAPANDLMVHAPAAASFTARAAEAPVPTSLLQQ
jgi:hypothetical protein